MQLNNPYLNKNLEVGERLDYKTGQPPALILCLEDFP